MTTFLIIIALIVIYFVIAGIKENEARETIERERKVNNRKLANMHYNNMYEQMMANQKALEESKKVLKSQMEKLQGIQSVNFEDDIMIIRTDYNISVFEADDYAREWINSLIPDTGINIVKIYDVDGFIAAEVKR